MQSKSCAPLCPHVDSVYRHTHFYIYFMVFIPTLKWLHYLLFLSLGLYIGLRNLSVLVLLKSFLFFLCHNVLRLILYHFIISKWPQPLLIYCPRPVRLCFKVTFEALSHFLIYYCIIFKVCYKRRQSHPHIWVENRISQMLPLHTVVLDTDVSLINTTSSPLTLKWFRSQVVSMGVANVCPIHFVLWGNN